MSLNLGLIAFYCYYTGAVDFGERMSQRWSALLTVLYQECVTLHDFSLVMSTLVSWLRGLPGFSTIVIFPLYVLCVIEISY